MARELVGGDGSRREDNARESQPPERSTPFLLLPAVSPNEERPCGEAAAGREDEWPDELGKRKGLQVAGELAVARGSVPEEEMWVDHLMIVASM